MFRDEAHESHAAGFHTPALFLVLSTASVETAEADAERAIQLAELARDCLRLVESELGEAAAPYQVRAHAVTGHALTCAGRLEDAARAFVEAMEPLEKLKDEPNPAALAELSLYLGLFEAARGNVDKALEKLATHELLMRGLVEWVEDVKTDDRG